MSTNIGSPAMPSDTTQRDPSDVSVVREVKIISHSPIFYWWPVWVLGLAIALAIYFDGGRLAYVPAGTTVAGNTLVAPDPHSVLDEPHDFGARNPYLGSWFFIVFLVVFVTSNVELRGLWEWIAALAIALALSIISTWGLWSNVAQWFRMLHIHMNMAGYLFLSVWLCVIWVATVFWFDRRTHIIFTAGQVRVLNEIGESEKVFDATNLTFQVLPNVFFRHRVLGLWGAGDLLVRTGGPNSEVFPWPNVLFVRSRLKEIQDQLKARDVV